MTERDILEKSQRPQEIAEKFLGSPGGPRDNRRTKNPEVSLSDQHQQSAQTMSQGHPCLSPQRMARD